MRLFPQVAQWMGRAGAAVSLTCGMSHSALSILTQQRLLCPTIRFPRRLVFTIGPLVIIISLVSRMASRDSALGSGSERFSGILFSRIICL